MSDKGLKACPRNDFNTKTKEDAYGNDIWGGKGVNPDYVIFLEEHYSPNPKPDWISVEKFYDKLEASQVELTSEQAEILYSNLFDMYDS